MESYLRFRKYQGCNLNDTEISAVIENVVDNESGHSKTGNSSNVNH